MTRLSAKDKQHLANSLARWWCDSSLKAIQAGQNAARLSIQAYEVIRDELGNNDHYAGLSISPRTMRELEKLLLETAMRRLKDYPEKYREVILHFQHHPSERHDTKSNTQDF